MDLLTFFAGYISKVLNDSKTVKEAKESFFSAAWDWVRPIFLKDADGEEKPPTIGIEEIREKLEEQVAQNPNFDAQLEKWMVKYKTQITKKNIFEGEINEIGGSVSIGDKKNTPSSNEHKEKNVFKGKVGRIGGDLKIGDD